VTTNIQKLELFADRAGLCIVDIQEKLAASIPEKVLKGTLRHCLNLIEAARVLGMPIIVTEQFSKRLGRSLPVVAESVLRLDSDQVTFFEKVKFNCSGLKAFDGWVKKSGRSQWILSGMETHVSVYQTARGMIAAGLSVHVPRDAVVSRTNANWETGLHLIEASGAVVTSTETVIFDLLKQAGTDEFQILSQIIK
jgi:nicotinamidase-related amidase